MLFLTAYVLLVVCLASASASIDGSHPSKLGHSHVLHFRGGRAALAPAPSLKAADDDAAPLQLKLVSPKENSLITLPTIEFERLGLTPGSRVRVRKMNKAALWSSVPDQAIGEAAADPELDAGVRLTDADMKALGLRVGEDVLVVPVQMPAAQQSPAAPGSQIEKNEQLERYRQQRRRHGWMRAAMWIMYGRPHYYGGYGGYGGYGYGHAYGGRHRYGGRPSYGSRSAYGRARGRRALGGRMGGRRR